MRATTETADNDLEPSITNSFHMFGDLKENKHRWEGRREPDGTSGGGGTRHLKDDPLDGAGGESDAAEERVVNLKAQNRIIQNEVEEKTEEMKRACDLWDSISLT